MFDSVSVATTFRETLKESGVIFMPSPRHAGTRARAQAPGQCGPHLRQLLPALNSAVFSDGSFVYVPKGVRCPMELSTYFRINAMNTGQFERTLIVVEDGAYVSYPRAVRLRCDENQLHCGGELVAEGNGEIKYSTVQNWYLGDEEGRGGIYNFVTKRGICKGAGSKIRDPGRDRLRRHLEVPQRGAQGRRLVGEYSVAVTNNRQQADTGTKMIHLGRNIAVSSCRRASPPVAATSPMGPGAHQQAGRERRNPRSAHCSSVTRGAHTFRTSR